MCGLTGFIDFKGEMDAAALQRSVDAMSASLAHRGPDDDGAFIDAGAGMALGFRRLSIIDLSAEGHQPMQSRNGRYVIVFNGEVYNFKEIRADLDSQLEGGDQSAWQGTSDTEVLLAAIQKFGVTGALERLDGMFALALWDRHESVLTLARDRIGEKPLYYGWQGRTFLFGSELKALTAHPDWKAALNDEALAAYMRFSYTPGPTSIYQGICKVPPGHMLTLKRDTMEPGQLPKATPYWDVRSVFEAAQEHPFVGTEDEACDALEMLLTKSVERRLISDVPLGVFLSGGVDSSMIAALAQKCSSQKIRTFTVGFNDPKLNEAGFAKAVAAHLETDHTEIMADEASVLKLVDRAPRIYDEPFADVSQLPTMLLAALTREHVTTVLSGDGGDELFAGYPRYQSAAKQWQRRNSLCGAVARTMDGFAPYNALNGIRAINGRSARLGDKLFRSLRDAGARGIEELQSNYMARWRTVDCPVSFLRVGRDMGEGADFYGAPDAWPAVGNDLGRLTYADAMTYLPDDLLVKLDRASMAVSLEARAPMLNHELVSFAWSLPSEFKCRDGAGKWLLRRALFKYVPATLVDRPKQGFEPPLADWLRGPLRDWAEDLLAPERLADGGWLAPKPIRAVWEEHLAGHRNWHFELWNVLMFQAWRVEWRV
jgi:asparagine synthase (glutamine-hydrolysing)